MKNLALLATTLIVLVCMTTASQAKSDKYVYRSRLNWVKVDKADPKEVPIGSLTHPFTEVNADEMEAMLLAIKISKKAAFKGDIQTKDIFDSWEARKYAPYFVEALAQLNPDQMVQFSIVHKRPKFLLRNDYLTMGNLWVATDGIHFQFTKVFAKLKGDYLALNKQTRVINEAKGLNTSLEADQGQQLAYGRPQELIVDPNHDWVDQLAIEMESRRTYEDQILAGGEKKNKKNKKDANSVEYTTAPAVESPSMRLRRLEKLKEDGLVSEEEYEKIRKRILSEL